MNLYMYWVCVHCIIPVHTNNLWPHQMGLLFNDGAIKSVVCQCTNCTLLLTYSCISVMLGTTDNSLVYLVVGGPTFTDTFFLSLVHHTTL